MGTILFVEDEPEDREHCCHVLREDGHIVYGASGAAEALAIYTKRSGQFDVIVLDQALNDEHGKRGGAELMKAIRQELLHVFPPRVLIRSKYDRNARDYLDDLRFHGRIVKAGNRGADEEMCDEVRKAYVDLHNAVEAHGNVEPFGEYLRTPYLGDLKFRQRVMHRAANWRKDEHIFLYGETGTGKGRLARVLHEYGPRFNKLYSPIKLQNIPHNLVQSWLFGHIKGSFTDALADKWGALVEAQGGTIFLDEIGYVKEEVASQLLSFLDDREVKPIGWDENNPKLQARRPASDRLVGSSALRMGPTKLGPDVYPIKSEVFVVVASQLLPEQMRIIKPLADALQGRLSRFDVLPLRERRSEIPKMMDYFRILYYQSHGLDDPPEFTAEVYRIYQDAHWPQNLRQFNKVLCRTLENTHRGYGKFDKKIEPKHFPEEIAQALVGPCQVVVPNVVLAAETAGLELVPSRHSDSPRLKTIDPYNPSYAGRIHPNFFSTPPPPNYGLFDKIAAIAMWEALTLNQGRKIEAARQLGLDVNRLRRWAENYLAEDVYKGFYPKANRPRLDDQGEDEGSEA